MKQALVGVAKHDFTLPADQVVKVAACSGRADFYLIGTQPTSGGCGTGNEAAQDPPTDAPATDPPTLAPDQTPPPNSVSDGTHVVPLASPSPSPSPSVRPSAHPQ